MTDGRGVDVVINTLPGDAIQKGLNCLSGGGRYVEIAMTALKSARGIDVSVLCESTPEQVRLIVHSILEETDGNGGIAASSGNSIPNYVPIENYVAMVAAIREYRGESLPAGWPWEPQTRKIS